LAEADAPVILLVEDDEDLRNAYRIVLSALGLRVVTADRGEDALSSLDAGPTDAIVADLGLPGLAGPRLVRSLRSAAPEAALAVLTGHDSDSLRRSCRAAGADVFLVKPVTARELKAVLEELLRSSSSGSPA